MPNKNEVTVIGHLGKDPEKRFSGNGKPMCHFSVAVTDKFKLNGEDHEKTNWIPFTAFGKSADIICSNFRKGDAIEVNARINMYKKDTDQYYQITLDAWSFAKPIYKVNESDNNSGSNQHISDDDMPF